MARKRPFSPAASICAVLLGCVLLLWVRSFSEGDLLGRERITLADDGAGAVIDGSGVFSACGAIGAGRFHREIVDPQQIAVARRKRDDAIRDVMPTDGSFAYHVIPEPHPLFRYGDPSDPSSFLGFVLRWGTSVLQGHTIETDHGVAIPYWFLALLFAVLPLRWLFGTSHAKETPSIKRTEGA